MSDTEIRLIYLGVGVVIGMLIGFFLWHRKGDHRKGLSALQITAFSFFFLYMTASTFLKIPFSDLVAIAIIGVFGGEGIGQAIADRIPKK